MRPSWLGLPFYHDGPWYARSRADVHDREPVSACPIEDAVREEALG
jgi:hypothetical protein